MGCQTRQIHPRFRLGCEVTTMCMFAMSSGSKTDIRDGHCANFIVKASLQDKVSCHLLLSRDKRGHWRRTMIADTFRRSEISRGYIFVAGPKLGLRRNILILFSTEHMVSMPKIVSGIVSQEPQGNTHVAATTYVWTILTQLHRRRKELN